MPSFPSKHILALLHAAETSWSSGTSDGKSENNTANRVIWIRCELMKAWQQQEEQSLASGQGLQFYVGPRKEALSKGLKDRWLRQ